MHYHYQNAAGETIGPVTVDELHRLRDLKIITEQTFVCTVGNRTWVPLHKLQLPNIAVHQQPYLPPPGTPQQSAPQGLQAPIQVMQGPTMHCQHCARAVGVVYDLNGWAILFLVLALVVPLWLITFPLFLWLAWTNRRGQRRCGVCRSTM